MGKDSFQITDVYSASYLILRGHDPKLIKAAGRIIFIFPNTPEIHLLVSEFNLGQQDVNVLLYSNVIRRLRAQLYAIKYGNGVDE